MGPSLIEIKQDKPGLNRFIGSWLCQGELNLVVDVGPANSVGRLVESLSLNKIERVDYVLLTHIHIDHAGGLAGLLEAFPMARVICHEKGIRHLVEPAKLWEGSLNTLGEVAEAYGPPRPVKEERFIPHRMAHIPRLTILETPGHAAHHLSYDYLDTLFAGEAGGNYFLVEDTGYLRPATPPRFFLEEFLGSVDRLRGLKDQRICYAHFGEAPSSHRMLARFREQLIRWHEMIRQVLAEGRQPIIERCAETLIARDPDLQAFHQLGRDRQEMERFFIANSVKGYLGFLREPAKQ